MRALFRVMLGVVLGWVARAWLATLRVHVIVDPALESVVHRPWVFSFWHGTQWPLLAWPRRRRTVVLVSHSSDGALQARALRAQGFEVVRGSSSRGGARGLAALVRCMRAGSDGAFAVDGPRGPYGMVKGGAIVAARASGGVLVPMGGGITRGVVFHRAWDRFRVAWPFTRVTVTLGAPLDPAAPDAPQALARAIATANVLAESAS
jgi:lysophospholipid acyltransferase (LPLAT)-like uncharacterized protein